MYAVESDKNIKQRACTTLKETYLQIYNDIINFTITVKREKPKRNFHVPVLVGFLQFAILNWEFADLATKLIIQFILFMQFYF